jgi:hypothetical protein
VIPDTVISSAPTRWMLRFRSAVAVKSGHLAIADPERRADNRPRSGAWA